MRKTFDRARWRRGAAMFAGLPLALATLEGPCCEVLPHAPAARGIPTAAQAAIERQPICIGSSVASAGDLADTLYYRAVVLADGQLAVGYFAFFSEERPWGNNWLTWSLLPALSVDLVYSRSLFVAPGLQRALYGAGDVEGVRVIYDVAGNGSLRVHHAVAEDRTEHIVFLSRKQVLSIDPRPTFYSDVWSHQLGARGARSLGDLAYVRCYQGDSIRPLPKSIAREFRLRGRALPAHVEALPGRRLDELRPARDAVARRAP